MTKLATLVFPRPTCLIAFEVAATALASFWLRECGHSTTKSDPSWYWSAPAGAMGASANASAAADGLADRFDGSQHLVCKIAPVSDHMLFVAVGTGEVKGPPRFNPYELAKVIGAGSHSPHEAALKYQRGALEPLQQIWRANRARYFEIGKEGNGPTLIPQGFAFIGLDQEGIISVAGSDFKLVGPPISIVRLSRKGSIEWVSRGVCQ
jgi:hypothetical protein